MAKKSMIANAAKKQAIAKKYAARRAELVAIVKSAKTSMEEKQEAYKAIAKLPRDSSKTRLRNRCKITGRPRGFLRDFEVSRIAFRELALKGELPGVTKASW